MVPKGTPLTLASLEGWRLQAAEHNAGQFSVDLQVISTPRARSQRPNNVQRVAFDITHVADTPELNFISAPEAPLTIATNGWLNLQCLGLKAEQP